MKKQSINKVLLSIILVLLAANIVMLYFLIKPNGSKHHFDEERTSEDSGMSAVLRKKVGFTEKQIADYMSLRKENRPNIRSQFSQLRTAKENFYNTLYQKTGDSTLNSLADSIALHQKLLDLSMRNYFQVVRQLCTPDQIPKMDSLLKRINSRMIGKSRKNNSSPIKK